MGMDSQAARSFYESERKNVVVTHDDFCIEQNFEYLSETDELHEYLLGRTDWESQFTVNRDGNLVCHVQILNQIFEKLFKVFSNRLDSVQIYHIVTDFYNLDSSNTYNRLVHSHRERLKKDLLIRIGEVTNKPIQIDKFKIQNNFETLFNI